MANNKTRMMTISVVWGLLTLLVTCGLSDKLSKTGGPDYDLNPGEGIVTVTPSSNNSVLTSSAVLKDMYFYVYNNLCAFGAYDDEEGIDIDVSLGFVCPQDVPAEYTIKNVLVPEGGIAGGILNAGSDEAGEGYPQLFSVQDGKNGTLSITFYDGKYISGQFSFEVWNSDLNTGFKIEGSFNKIENWKSNEESEESDELTGESDGSEDGYNDGEYPEDSSLGFSAELWVSGDETYQFYLQEGTFSVQNDSCVVGGIYCDEAMQTGFEVFVEFECPTESPAEYAEYSVVDALGESNAKGSIKVSPAGLESVNFTASTNSPGWLSITSYTGQGIAGYFSFVAYDENGNFAEVYNSEFDLPKTEPFSGCTYK